MKLFYKVIIILLFSFVYSSSIEEFSSCIVAIQGKKIRLIKINKESYELWLKGFKSLEAFPHEEKKTGTGFIVKDNGSNRIFLVTARHVIDRLNKIKISMKSNNKYPYSIKLNDIKRNGVVWVNHPSTDVSVIELDENKMRSSSSGLKRLPISMINPSKKAPSINRKLMAIGFPLGLGLNPFFSPIKKESNPSSGLFSYPFFPYFSKGALVYALQDTTVGGFSGAPIFNFNQSYTEGSTFVVSSEPIECFGLIHGTTGDDNGRLAIVVPSFYILETIQKALIKY